MGIRFDSKIILGKTEVTYGTDPTPAAANGILMTGVTIRPMDGEDVSRELELPYLGGQEQLTASLRVELTGKVELVPSGTAGTAPKWGPLLRACGCAETIVAATSVTYNPVTDSHESITLYFWMGGTLHKILGARGNALFRWTAQGIPYLEFTFTGLYGGVTETSRTAPTLTGFKRPKIVSKAATPTFTINSVSLVMRSCALDLRNQVEPRLLVGLEEVIIVDRADQISAQVEAVPVSTFNPYTLGQASEAASLIAVSLVHGTAAGYITTLSAPTCQLQRLSGFENQQKVLEWPLTLNALPNTGNDQWTLTLT
jgi:hypothetical protein